jgi:nucleotide-binding universal stress UspA family protein
VSGKRYKIEKKIKKFEQALIPEKETFVLPKIKSILLALDAHEWIIESSRQSYKVACELSQRNDAVVTIICMAITQEEHAISEKLVNEAVDYLTKRNVNSQGFCIVGSPSVSILKLLEEESIDLLVLPSPFAERVEKDNEFSLGATVEILLNKSKVPLLLLTELGDTSEKISERILLPVQGKDDVLSIEWALALSSEVTRLNILNTVRTESIEVIKGVSQDILDEDINERLIEISLRKYTTSLLNVLKSGANEIDIDFIVLERVGDLVDVITDELVHGKTTLLIVNSKMSLENGSVLVKLAKKYSVPLLITRTHASF